jgi:putative N6-adenine-specific DNA methylase
MFRDFAFQQFARYDQSMFDKEFEAAKEKIMLEKKHTIIASDIDPRMISIAQENARHAGVADYITFNVKDVKDYLDGPPLDGCLVSNPPYGARLNTFDLENIYHTITELFIRHPKLHGGVITSYEKFDTDT